MIITQQIPVEHLSGIGLHEEVTRHVLARLDSAFLVQIAPLETGKSELQEGTSAKEWLRTALRSAQLKPDETLERVRMGCL